MHVDPLRFRLLALPLLGLLGCTAPSARSEPGAPTGSVPEMRASDPSRAPRDLTLLHLGTDGLARKGYDPVAYFPEGGGRARKGSPDLAARHAGVLYRFASEANRDRFLAEVLREQNRPG